MGVQNKIIIGDKINRLTLIGQPYRKGTLWRAVFKCDCGSEKDIIMNNVASHHTVSCGCYARSLKPRGNLIHGRSRSPTWQSYTGMLSRCYNKNQHAHHRYGGRGISVCPRWLSGFVAFYEDMGERPPGTTLDRIDNDGNYEPGNCRWATQKQQRSNRSDNRRITWCGVTKTMSEWANITGIDRHNIANRLDLGWPPEKALTVAAIQGRNQYGKHLTTG